MYFIVNKSLEVVGEITTFSSINWEEEYLSQSGGDFEIVLPASDYSSLNIKEGFFIYKNNSKKFGLINYIEYIDNFTEDEKVEQLIKIKGEMGESILKRRVIAPQLNKSGTLDSIFKSVINTHFTNPKDSKRKINLEYIPNTKYSTKVNKCVTGCTVAELFESICSSKEYSYRVYLDLNSKKFYCNIINGSDKSGSVIFSKEDDNLANFKYVRSQENLKTHIIVAGEGEGDDRTIVTVSNINYSGLNRIESYLDKDSLSSKDLTKASYKTKLIEEGKTELNKHSTSEGSEFDVFLNNYEVGTDFNLGDKVKIIDENLGIETTTRVLAVLYSSDENGVETIQVTLGNVTKIDIENDEKNEDNNDEDKDDTTNESKTTSDNSKYIKITAYDEDGKTLSDLEFSGGFFKMKDKVYLLVLKNNSNKIIDKISYKCTENLLKSENIIYINYNETINCFKTHSVKNNIHSYSCYMSSYSNLTKIISVGDEYNNNKIDEKYLYYCGNIETFLCDDTRMIDGRLTIENGNISEYYSHFSNPVSIATDEQCIYINIAKHNKEIQDYGLGYHYYGYISTLTDDNYNKLLSFLKSTITYNIKCNYDVYYKIVDKNKNVSKLKKMNNGIITCKNGEIIKVYIYTPEQNSLSNYSCQVTMTNNNQLQFLRGQTLDDDKENNYTHEPLMCENGIYLRSVEDNNVIHTNMKNVDKIDFTMKSGHSNAISNAASYTVYIINKTNEDDYLNIISSYFGSNQVSEVLKLYPKLDESTSI